MLKTLAAVAALALVPTIASASTVMSFECEVTRVTPPEKNDYNPVVNTTLSTVYVGNRLTGFAVEHETADGNVYVRQQQYRNQRVWAANRTASWAGQSVHDSGLKMVGTLMETSRGLFYVEQIFRNGRVETTITHSCESV
jgi:hypothetical protein